MFKKMQSVSLATMVRIVWANAAGIVTIPVDVTDSQVIVTEDVKQDGQEALVINVRICLFGVFFWLYPHFLKKSPMLPSSVHPSVTFYFLKLLLPLINQQSEL